MINALLSFLLTSCALVFDFWVIYINVLTPESVCRVYLSAPPIFVVINMSLMLLSQKQLRRFDHSDHRISTIASQPLEICTTSNRTILKECVIRRCVSDTFALFRACAAPLQHFWRGIPVPRVYVPESGMKTVLPTQIKLFGKCQPDALDLILV
ncbi:hypothetical protein DL98DRAFT_276321 [Cadophora sp. DSE1049]|nr:hypothetical protein DL98DRAFT_276321 [Cadophora sp. DSE1049]